MQVIGRVWDAVSPCRVTLSRLDPESGSEESSGSSGGSTSSSHSYGFVPGQDAGGSSGDDVDLGLGLGGVFGDEDLSPLSVSQRMTRLVGFRRSITRKITTLDPEAVRRAEMEELRGLICRRDLLDAEVQDRRNKLGFRGQHEADGADRGDSGAHLAASHRAVVSGGRMLFGKGTSMDGGRAGRGFRSQIREQLVEQRLRSECVFGAHILCAIIMVVFGVRLLAKFVKVAICSASGSRESSIHDVDIYKAIVWVTILCMLVSVIYWCSNPYFYYFTVLLTSAFVAAHGFLPLGPDCQVPAVSRSAGAESAIFSNIVGTCSSNSLVKRVEGVCTEKFAFVEMIAVWLLLSAFFIPKSRLMHVNWVAIWSVFLLPLIVWVQSNDRVTQSGKFDSYVVVIFMCIINFVAFARKWNIEERDSHSLALELKQTELSRRMFHLLEYMVPGFVIMPMLREPGGIIAKRIPCATVLFVLINDFDAITQKMPPQKLLNFLNRHFVEFDKICERHGVTKIETVREEFVCAAGVSPEDLLEAANHGHTGPLGNLIRVAMEILSIQQDLAETEQATARAHDQTKYLKCGMHTGSLFAGVIGHKLPRFRLFGDTMNTAARMMQRGLPGELQFGLSTKLALPDWVPWKSRGCIEMKGKGQVEAFLLDREVLSPAESALDHRFGVWESSRSPAQDVEGGGRSRRRSATASASASSGRSAGSQVPRRLCLGASASASASSEVDAGAHFFSASDSLDSRANANASDLRRFQNMLEAMRRFTDPGTDWGRRKKDLGPPVVSYDVILRSNANPNLGLKDGHSNNDLNVPSLRAEFEEWYVVESFHRNFERRMRRGLATLLALSAAEFTVIAVGFLGSTNISGASGTCTIGNVTNQDRYRRCRAAAHPVLLPSGRLADGSRGSCWSWPYELNEERICGIKYHCEDTSSFCGGHTCDEKAGLRPWADPAERLDIGWCAGSEPARLVSARCPKPSITAEGENFQQIGWSQLTYYAIIRGVAVVAWGAWYKYNSARTEWWYDRPRSAQRALMAVSTFVAVLFYASTWTLPLCDELQEAASRNSLLPVPALSPVRFVRLEAGMVFIVLTFSNTIFYTQARVIVVLAMVISISCFAWSWHEESDLHDENTGDDRGFIAGMLVVRFVFFVAVVLHAYAVRVTERKEMRQFQTKRAMETSQSRMSTILNTLMPPLVVEELRRNPPMAALPCHRYHRATLAQADLVGFTAMCNGLQPSEVVALISDIFGLFDEITDVYEVYKIETVGDAYIAGQAETPLTRRNSPLEVARFALHMVKRVHEWSHANGQVVNCRVGIHTGECVGGIVGSNMQRYHLFGKMMSEVEVLESTAPAGHVQASSGFWDALEPELEDRRARGFREAVALEPRSLSVLSTSKGETHPLSDVGGPTYLVSGAGVRGL